MPYNDIVQREKFTMEDEYAMKLFSWLVVGSLVWNTLAFAIPVQGMTTPAPLVERGDKPAPVALPAKFMDVEASWAKKTLERWLEKRWLTGYADGRVQPDRAVTRAEFVTMINRTWLEGAAVPMNEAVPTFADVRQGSWYEDALHRVVRAGAVRGYPDGTFRPDAPLTRQEAATIAVQLEGQLDKGTEGGSHFVDYPKFEAWAKPFVSSAIKQQLMNGYPDGTFQPLGRVTRAETVVMLERLLSKKPPAPKQSESTEKQKAAFRDVFGVRGVVTQAGQPVADAIVRVYEQNGYVVQKEVRTQADGRYEVPLTKGVYDLTVSKNEYIGFVSDVSVQTAVASTETNVILQRGVEIRGTVTSDASNVIEKRKVLLTTNPTFETITSTESGSFRLFVLPNRAYTVRVQQAESSTVFQEINIPPVWVGMDAVVMEPIRLQQQQIVARNNSTNEVDVSAPELSVKIENNKVVLSWKAVSGAVSYTVKRGIVSGQYQVLKDEILREQYTDDQVNGTMSYYYVVTANKNNKESKNSNEVVYKVRPNKNILFGTYDSSKSRITWTKSNGADRYTLYRSTVQGGPYIPIAENLITFSFEDLGLQNNVVYYYVMKSINEVGESDFSNELMMGSSLPNNNLRTFDAVSDSDGDGLDNAQELAYGTDVFMVDTDRDGLLDGYEVSIGTSPVTADTDGDGWYDGAETIAGTDPKVANPMNTATKQAQTINDDVRVVANGDGNLLIAPLQVKLIEHALLSSLPGVIGKPIEVTAGGFPISEATITIRYNSGQLGGLSPESLGIFYVNPETKQLELLSDIQVNQSNNTVTAKTNHFSTFLLGNKNMPIDLGNVDIVFAIDQSGSMSYTDPQHDRIHATEKFVEKMDEKKQRMGIVSFTSSAQIEVELTNSAEALRKKLDTMRYASGGTNIGAALAVSGTMLTEPTRKKTIILLSDGQSDRGDVYQELPQLATKQVVVHTVALGSGADLELMQKIASDTGGGYYFINNTGGLSREDIQKQIDLIYEKLSKELTFEGMEQKANALPQSVMITEFGDIYLGTDSKDVAGWLDYTGANVLTGNYVEKWEDVRIAGAGLPLTFERTYNSFAATVNSVIGKGFRTNIDTKANKKVVGGVVRPSLLAVRKTTSSTSSVIAQVARGLSVEIKETIAQTKMYKISYIDKRSNKRIEGYVPQSQVSVAVTIIDILTPSGSTLSFERDSADGAYKAPSDTEEVVTEANGQIVVTTKDQQQTVYDATTGLLRARKDRYGNTVTYMYTGNQLTRMTDMVGRSLTFAYENGRISRVTDPIGRTTTYTYGANGLLIKVRDELGNVIEYVYDAAQRLNKVINEKQVAVRRNDYDVFGRIIRHYDAFGNSVFYIYDDRARTRSMINENGKESQVKFNADLKMMHEINTYGNRTTYTYYAERSAGVWENVTTFAPAGSTVDEAETEAYKDYVSRYKNRKVRTKIEKVDARGNRTTTIYDANDNMEQTIDALGNSVTYTYDVTNNVRTQTNANGGVQRYTYDANGVYLLTETNARGGETRYAYVTNDPAVKVKGLVKSVTDARGNVTQYAYGDAANNRTAETNALNETTTYRYDGVGRKIEEIDADNGKTEYAYDAVDRVVRVKNALGGEQKTEYDAAGNKVAEVDELGRRTTYEYDVANRLVRMRDAAGKESTRQYDLVGNITRQENRNGHVTEYTYDALNRLLSEKNALGKQTYVEYDAVGNKTAEVDELGRRMTYTYDALNRLIRVTDAAGGFEEYAYDRKGNRTKVSNKNRVETRYVYDELDRLTETTVELGGGQRVTDRVAYDAVGNKTSVTDRNGKVTEYTYDALNRMAQKKDALTNTTTYAYDRGGNLVRVTDALGRVTEYAYDALNRLLSEKNALNGIQRTEYDAVGNKTAEVDELGRRTTYTYDVLNRLVRETDARGGTIEQTVDAEGNVLKRKDKRGHETHYAYDRENRLIQTKFADGGVTEYVYDDAGNKTEVRLKKSETDAQPSTTKYEYDALNRVVKEIDALNQQTVIGYDAEGNKTSETDRRGNRTEYAYDAMNRLTRTTVTVSPGVTYTDTIAYDPEGNKTSTTDRNGKVTQYAYDALNRMVRKTDARGKLTQYAYDKQGNMTEETSALNQKTEYTYDALNRVISEKNALNGVQQTEYDAVGNKTAEVDELGRRTTYTYDVLNRLVEEKDALNQTIQYVYDAGDNNTAKTDKRGNQTQYAYDAMNRLTQTTNPDGSVMKTEYDTLGNKTAVIDPRNYRTTFVYDKLNRVIKETDAHNRDKLYGYDAEGNKTSETDRRGKTTTYGYDGLDRLIRVTNALNQTTTYAYDGMGNLLTQTDGKGQATQYTYTDVYQVATKGYADGKSESLTHDDVGRLIGKVDRKGVTHTWTYDALDRETKEQVGTMTTDTTYDAVGNKTSQVDSSGTTTYTYDAEDRLLSETWSGKTTQYAYDGQGNKTKVTDPAGKETTYTYDTMNRLATVTALNQTTTYTYDASGNRSSLTYPNNTKTEYMYDARNWLTELKLTITETNPAATTLHDRPSETITQPNGKVTVRYNYTYTYDANGNQLTKEEPTGRTTYAYTELNQLQEVTDPYGRKTEYTYDGAGNRTTEVVTVPDTVTKDRLIADGMTATETNAYGVWRSVRKTYAYNAVNQLETVVEKDTADAIVKMTAYTHDANGNQVEENETVGALEKQTEMSYDEHNRLVRWKQGVKEATYGYDGFGMRRTKTIGGKTTTYVYAQSKEVLYEQDGDGKQYSHVLGINRIARAEGTRTEYYGYNGHADVVLTLDATGQRNNVYAYDAFGVPEKEKESGVSNPYRYAGYMYDTESEQYYLRARYYNAEHARFLTEDTYTGSKHDPLSLNLYTYVMNNPLMYYDPTGHIPTKQEAAQMAEHIYKKEYNWVENINGNKSRTTDACDGCRQWRLIQLKTGSDSLKMGIYILANEDKKNPSEYTVVFKGTDNPSNWINNFQSYLTSTSDDLWEAITFSKEFVKNNKDREITFVGHSKGGGEAIAAAVKNNKKAITFNAANFDFEKYRLKENSKEDIINYYVDGEILYNSIGPSRFGVTEILPTQFFTEARIRIPVVYDSKGKCDGTALSDNFMNFYAFGFCHIKFGKVVDIPPDLIKNHSMAAVKRAL